MFPRRRVSGEGQLIISSEAPKVTLDSLGCCRFLIDYFVPTCPICICELPLCPQVARINHPSISVLIHNMGRMFYWFPSLFSLNSSTFNRQKYTPETPGDTVQRAEWPRTNPVTIFHHCDHLPVQKKNVHQAVNFSPLHFLSWDHYHFGNERCAPCPIISVHTQSIHSYSVVYIYPSVGHHIDHVSR